MNADELRATAGNFSHDDVAAMLGRMLIELEADRRYIQMLERALEDQQQNRAAAAAASNAVEESLLAKAQRVRGFVGIQEIQGDAAT